MTQGSCLRDASIALLIAIAWLSVLEGGMRVAGVKHSASLFRSDPLRCVSYRPFAEGWYTEEGEAYVKINSRGYRDRERNLRRPENSLRIAVIGDSYVSATQLPIEQTFPALMEQRLSRQGAAEVLNMGTTANSLQQDYYSLRDDALVFDPQIVIVPVMLRFAILRSVEQLNPNPFPFPYFTVVNGKLVETDRSRAARRQPQVLDPYGNDMTTPRGWPGRLWLGLKETELAALFWQIPQAIQNSLDQWGLSSNSRPWLVDYRSEWSHAPRLGVVEEAWQISEFILAEMNREAAARGVEFWVALVGDEVEVDPDATSREALLKREGLQNLDYAKNRLGEYLSAKGIRYVNLVPGMMRFAMLHQVALHGLAVNPRPDLNHWNANGHMAASMVLADELLARSPAVSRWMDHRVVGARNGSAKEAAF